MIKENLKPAAEEPFSTVANATSLMIWQTDDQKQCTYLNNAWLDFMGYPLKGLIGLKWKKIVHPDDLPRYWEVFSQAFDARKPFTHTCRARRFDGIYRWVLNNGQPRYDSKGQFCGYSGYCLDVSEKKKAEVALQRSEEVSHAVLESLRGYIAITNAEGALVRCNTLWQKASESFHNSSMIQGLAGDDYLAICRRASLETESGQRAYEGLQSALAGSDQNLSFEYVSEISAEVRWFYMDIVPLRYEGGGAVISHLDITDQKKAEIDAEDSRLELAHMRRVSTIGEMAASIAHELNQPLTAILSNTQAAIRILKADPPNYQEVQTILLDVIADDKRAGEVIRRLRVLLKKQAPEPRPLQINVLIQEVTQMLHSDTILRQSRIHLDLEEDLPAIYGDEVQLQQVLLNLVLNGLDAMVETPFDQRIVDIHSHRDGDESIRISVKDHGHGIGVQQLERIFSPFFTTKSEGLGLGLAVTHSIIRDHKGRIWAENNAGNGAVFHFNLPVHHPVSQEVATA